MSVFFFSLFGEQLYMSYTIQGPLGSLENEGDLLDPFDRQFEIMGGGGDQKIGKGTENVLQQLRGLVTIPNVATPFRF